MKICIVGPSFFSYAEAIAKEISLHAECYTFNEIHSNSIFVKIAYRLNFSFIFKKKVARHRAKLYKFIQEKQISDVLFISPDIIDRSLLATLKSKARVHLYMWDGFDNKKNALSVLELFDSRSSFDIFDCKKYQMTYIPLFAEEEFKSSDCFKQYDLSFCGTIHSDRPLWIVSFLKYSRHNKLRLGLFLYYYSRALALIRLGINNGSFALFGRVSYQPYSKASVAQIFRSSKVVIDLTHPKQNGLTSRTFEALRSGSRVATNNINASVLYEQFPSRIFVFDNGFAYQPEFLEFINGRIDPLDQEQDRFLSVERFAGQILECLND